MSELLGKGRMFSKDRAVRGAKIGFAAGAGLLGSDVILAGIVDIATGNVSALADLHKTIPTIAEFGLFFWNGWGNN